MFSFAKFHIKKIDFMPRFLFPSFLTIKWYILMTTVSLAII